MKKTILFLMMVLTSGMLCFGQIELTVDINPGAENSWPKGLTAFKGDLYIIADNGDTGSELFRYTAGGDLELVFNLGSGSSDGVLPFEAGNRMLVLGDYLYFLGYTADEGWEMMRYDGDNPPSLAGTPPTAGATGSEPKYPVVLDNKIYFQANTATFGKELYVYFPSSNLVVRAKDVYTGEISGNPSHLVAYNDKLYFSGLRTFATGAELYEYDPATGDLNLVANINSELLESSEINHTVVHNDVLYFTATEGEFGRELYSYDGTDVICHTDFYPGDGDGVLTIYPYGNKLCFFGSDGVVGHQLALYDYSDDSVTPIGLVNSGSFTSVPEWMEYNDILYFTTSVGELGFELWKTDGTEIEMVQDLFEGIGSGFPAYFCLWNGTMYMSAYTSEFGYEVYELHTESTAGVNETDMHQVKIYPNPVKDVLNIAFEKDGNYAYSLYSLAGQQVKSGEFDRKTNQLTVSGLPKGMYVLKITDQSGKSVSTHKILVK